MQICWLGCETVPRSVQTLFFQIWHSCEEKKKKFTKCLLLHNWPTPKLFIFGLNLNVRREQLTIFSSPRLLQRQVESHFFFLPSTRTGCRLTRSSINSSWDAVEIILKQTGTQLGAMLVYNFQVQAEPENGTAPWCVHRADALTAKRDVGGEQSWSYHCYLISLAFH